MPTSRRKFIRSGAMAGAGLLLPGTAMQAASLTNTSNMYAGDELLRVSYALLKTWGEGMLALQVHRPGAGTLHGGLLCPACATIHGRSGDAVLPFLFLYDKTKDRTYLQAALDVYEWMENTVSCPDGAWINEVNVSGWKGTTVFAATAVAESIHHYGHLLGTSVKARWTDRLRKATDYVFNTFTIKTGNINYPVAASYALSLAGKVLKEQKYIDRGRELGHQALANITPKDHLLWGEGHPIQEVSPKGCYVVDLGYNVEESLPCLVMYAMLMNDTEVLQATHRMLKTHLEFMLPDGAWDNSWGTRNFKWTWWGSRTSDGCQPAYGLMADQEPAFYKAALRNTLLMQQCTHNKLLHGGPHYVNHYKQPCVHHTFSHSKALAVLLMNAQPADALSAAKLLLPREQEYGVKAFPDINTWLVANNKWRGTITGYDQEYTMKGGHASGGALSLLWHAKAGPIIVASMNRYQMTESFNMQRDDDLRSMSFTPRFETVVNGATYTTINDLRAIIEVQQQPKEQRFTATASLVDEGQVAVPGTAKCVSEYIFTNDQVIIRATHKHAGNGNVEYVLPLIARSDEKVRVIDPHSLQIIKKGGVVTIRSSTAFQLQGEQQRLFNFVPGMQGIALRFSSAETEIKIQVMPV